MNTKVYNFLILYPFLIMAAFCSSLSGMETTHRTETPTAIYGPENAKIEIFIGNGGAGPTCLLEALSEDFIASKKLDIRIAWIQTISRFTLENLQNKIIDLSLTYEADPELLAVKEGWASERTLVFNDHFIIVGPKSNPAKVLSTDTPEDAFKKIATQGTFISRNDLSGSNQRERRIWNAIGLQPWNGNYPWYVAENVFPADALSKADREGHYTITDRGTLLAIHKELNQMAVYIQNGQEMMNRCHAMLQDNPSAFAKDFLNYLISPRAQNLIAEYRGKDKNCVYCCPLFTPAKEDQFLGPDCLIKIGLAANK